MGPPVGVGGGRAEGRPRRATGAPPHGTSHTARRGVTAELPPRGLGWWVAGGRSAGPGDTESRCHAGSSPVPCRRMEFELLENDVLESLEDLGYVRGVERRPVPGSAVGGGGGLGGRCRGRGVWGRPMRAGTRRAAPVCAPGAGSGAVDPGQAGPMSPQKAAVGHRCAVVSAWSPFSPELKCRPRSGAGGGAGFEKSAKPSRQVL